jgi:ABC-2 family transporter protein
VIHFAWLQSRAQFVAAAVGLVAVAILAAVTGPHLAHLYDTTVASCHVGCHADASTFFSNDHALRIGFDALVAVVPAILGMFLGAPLIARELEERTFKLAFTQSVTRSGWLVAKLAVVGLAAVAAAGVTSLIVTWWAAPLDHAQMNPYATFDYRDIAPVGYAAFAFVLAAVFGLLLRRTLAAMVLTLVAFLAARLAADHWIRPNLLAPLHKYLALNPATTGYGNNRGGLLPGSGPATSSLQPVAPNIPRAWITSIQIVNHHGARLGTGALAHTCPQLVNNAGGGGAQGAVPASRAAQRTLHDCVARIGTKFHEVVGYQPASRYWTFQWLELAIYVAAALILAGACLWLIRRRLA